MSGPANGPPLNEWQTKTLENQAELIQATKEVAAMVEAASGHLEDCAAALKGLWDVLDRLELKLK